jgi:hypothetical protein
MRSSVKVYTLQDSSIEIFKSVSVTNHGSKVEFYPVVTKGRVKFEGSEPSKTSRGAYVLGLLYLRTKWG